MPDFFEDVARKWKSFSGARRSLRIDEEAVRSTYARWAPIYDVVFGAAFRAGRRAAVETVNQLPPGRILECGVGTGISLPYYDSAHQIVGIDLSPEMLDLARRRVEDSGLSNVEDLAVADAGDLPDAADAYDAAVAMFVMTVVPDPKAVMSELIRVTRPGGAVVLVSHFPDQKGWRKWIGQKLAPISASIGWHTDFAVERILGRDELRLVERRRVGPLGFFTLLVFERL